MEYTEKKKKSKLSGIFADDKFALSNKNRAFFYIALSALSFVFCLLFFYCTSPLSTYCGADSGFFFAVGQGMTKGFLPYRDYFDMKGPYLFLIEYLGQLISYGRWGIFLVEWLNLSIVYILISRIIENSGTKNILAAVLMFVPVVWFSVPFMGGGNLTEEYSLIPLFLCLLLYMKYCKSESEEHNIFYGAVYGFCFGFIALIRVTNAALICAIVLCVTVDLIKNGKWKNLFANGGMFILGVAAAFAPMLVYYQSKGLLSEMLNDVFVFGFRYSSEKGLVQHIIETVKTPARSLLAAVPVLTVLLDKNRNYKKVLFAVFGSLGTILAISMGNNYFHYYTLIIPMMVFTEVIIVEDILKSDNRVSVKSIVLVIFAVSMLAQWSRVNLIIHHANLFVVQQNSSHVSRSDDISSHIPEDELDSVYCYNILPVWYAYTDIVPCIKYCGWQNHYIRLVPEIREEIKEIFETEPPRWLVLPKEKGELPDFLAESLEKDYTFSYGNHEYSLYLLNN